MLRLASKLGLSAALTTVLTLAIAVPASAAQTAYITDSASGAVAAAPVTATGGLGATLAPVATTGGTGNEALALTPNGARLFTNDGSNLAAFPVTAATGALGPLAATPSDFAYGLVVTPDGRFAYQGAGGSGIYGFSLGTDGTVGAAVPGSPLVAADAPDGLAVTPDGKFLYSANNNDSTIGAFSIAANGSLTELPGSPFASAADPYAISLSPDGKHVYVPGRTGTPQQVFIHDIAANGTLTPNAGSPVNMGGGVQNSFGSSVTADGKYFFTADFATANLSGFAINATGGLTELAGSPYALGGSPAAVTSSDDGSHIYVTDSDNVDIDVLAVGANGVPTAVTGSPFTVGVMGDFQSVALSPNQPPVATLSAAVSKDVVSFDAGGTTDPDSTVAGYVFDFGDGETLNTTSAKPSHKYANAGTYAATVTATDAEGCSTTYVSSGQTAFCNGGPGATKSIEVKVADKGKPKLKVSAKGTQKLGKPLKLKVTSDEGAKVSAKAKAKLKGADKGSVPFKAAKVKIGKSGKAKLKLKLSKSAAKIAEGASSGKVKVKLTASSDGGKTIKTVKIKLK